MTLEDLPAQTPRSWNDFMCFYQKLAGDKNLECLIPSNFLELPFEMQFGIFASYLLDQGLDIDLHAWNKEILIATICDNFMIHENMIDHFS